MKKSPYTDNHCSWDKREQQHQHHVLLLHAADVHCQNITTQFQRVESVFIIYQYSSANTLNFV